MMIIVSYRIGLVTGMACALVEYEMQERKVGFGRRAVMHLGLIGGSMALRTLLAMVLPA